jgi:hypothetical protein
MTADAEGFRVRLPDGEVFVEDTVALVAMARAGRIGRATQVCGPGETQWVRADSIPKIERALRSDPWSAWDSEDGGEMLEEYAQPPLREALTNPPPPTEPRDAVAELPDSAMRPMETKRLEPAVSPLPVRRASGKVIAFPDTRMVSTAGPHALDRELRDPAARPDESPAGSGINWLRLFMLAGLAVATMSIWVWYVHRTAAMEPTRTAPLVVRSAAPEAAKVVKDPEGPSPYEQLEDDLRAQLMEGILDIPSEEAFEDALHIELRRERLDVAWVRVRIESWAGRNQELPQRVAIQVRLGGRDGELDRELAAVGLVLGKYLQHYGLEASRLAVLIEDDKGTVRQVNMDSNVAKRFFTHRLPLERFLNAAFRGSE